MPKMTRANHSLSHYRLATFDMGLLVPLGVVEVLMGDTFVHSTSLMLRASTLVTPVMHPVDVRVHHWYVPNRIIWDEWDEFITGRDPELTVPTINPAVITQGQLLDHMGVPPRGSALGPINVLPVRAYNKIWNEYYRDQDIITERTEDDITLARIGWGKDYFTTCRPTPQQGTAISIPFSAGTVAPVLFARNAQSGDPPGNEVIGDQNNASDSILNIGTRTVNDGSADNATALQVDLASSAGAGIDVNEFRMAMAMQRHLEARNRWGSRIQDYLGYHGVRARDGRLDLPEYCGGGKSVIAFSEVLATAEGDSTNVGDQAGHGIVALRTRRYGRFFPESGWVLSLASVRPRGIYADQLHRQWMRSLKDDYWQKEYESFGPQAVVTREVFANHGNQTDVFGYNGRHDEYRRHPSYVSGQFRSLDDDWHMARFFMAAPALNQQFIECLPTDRIYADVNEPEVRVMASHHIRAKRLVSKRSRY